MAVRDLDCLHQPSPHRPSLSDVQNGKKKNKGKPAPDQPAAEEDNHKSALIVAYGAVLPLAILSVTYNVAGQPRVFSLATVRRDVAATDIVLTDHGNGDVSVQLPSGKYPPANVLPVVALNGTTGTSKAEAEYIAGGARVRSSNAAGSLADIPFTLWLYGS